ncbi:MAG: hypothetical protein KKH29_04870 [Candidatus Omnitrophica bacterium]|nr:hypothetical protein [Candidatus Omnitrophota bacterium]
MKKRVDTAESGFLVKLDRKEVTHCFAVAFDYDLWEYIINGKETQKLPENVETINVVVGRT